MARDGRPSRARPPKMADEGNDEDLEWKREYNIRQREREYERKQKEVAEKKNKALEQKKAEESALEKKRMEAIRKQAVEAQTRKKTAAVENEYRERCREVKIAKRMDNWKQRSEEMIRHLIEDFSQEERERHDTKLRLKEEKNERLREAAYNKGLEKHKLEILEAQREQVFRVKEQMRKEKELMRVEKLKAEQHAEIEEAAYSQTTVPLKSTLVASLTATPAVSVLLAALKDQTEDLDDLKECDLETRAKQSGQPLFKYVKKLKEDMESTRCKAPEPVAIDGMAARRTTPAAGKAAFA